MPPQNKTQKVATSDSKKKGEALKRKTQPLDVLSNTEWTVGDEKEPSRRYMVENMDTLLSI